MWGCPSSARAVVGAVQKATTPQPPPRARGRYHPLPLAVALRWVRARPHTCAHHAACLQGRPRGGRIRHQLRELLLLQAQHPKLLRHDQPQQGVGVGGWSCLEPACSNLLTASTWLTTTDRADSGGALRPDHCRYVWVQPPDRRLRGRPGRILQGAVWCVIVSGVCLGWAVS